MDKNVYDKEMLNAFWFGLKQFEIPNVGFDKCVFSGRSLGDREKSQVHRFFENIKDVIEADNEIEPLTIDQAMRALVAIICEIARGTQSIVRFLDLLEKGMVNHFLVFPD